MTGFDENLPPATGEPSHGILTKAARPAEMLLGLVFLVSALLKANDIDAFIIAIGLYGVVAGDTIQTAVALITLAIESALGTALVLGWRPRALTLGGAAALLLAFSGLILYGWLVNGITDCGCTGAIKIGPKMSLLKNAALLALAATAMAGLRQNPGTGRGVIAKTAAALLCAAVITGYSYSGIEPPSAPLDRPFSQFVLEVDGHNVDLGKGEYLVAVFSSTCDHCMASVEKLNPLAELRNFPPVVGLIEGSPESIQQFELFTGPQFPLHPIGLRTFSEFIDKFPPRFVLVRDGIALHTWDDEVPTPEAVIEASRDTAPSSG
ncbi:MAG: hypothetical protein RBU21_22000 [FCB group bacterium]|jgi:hypothetical protein|nr:hypothetical protein [FCB group bacterium]